MTQTIDTYQHQTTRANAPEAGTVRPETDPDLDWEFAEWSREPHDPNLDPHLGLSYAGKTYKPMQIETRSLHIHEHIHPKACLENVKKSRDDKKQPPLFSTSALPAEKAIEFYQHQVGWANRMIAGDSFLAMNSLLEREQMAGKVQTIYFDPPYGMNYNSNFQPFTHDKNVRDKDRSTEPEMVKAYRDTWNLGIHSYLTYMRDRLHLCQKLLTDEGSIFVQMGDENFMRVGLLMDEVFGAENRVTVITYVSAGGSSAKTLPDVSTYLLWYAKDISKVRYHQLYESMTRKELIGLFSSYAMVQLSDGTNRKLTKAEQEDPDKHLPNGARLYNRTAMFSQGRSTTGRSDSYFLAGKEFPCPDTLHWSVSHSGLDRLAELGRLDGSSRTRLSWKKYENEVPGRRIHNVWPKMSYAQDKRYVVETANSIIERCLLMTSDPGDLVFDPTCGSGTTAYVAEQWGRRWITCDTSRVALTLAKQRLTTAVFDYYELADEKGDDVSQGFKYKTVPYVSAKTLAYDEDPTVITLYNQPNIPKGKKNCRVSGPFTFEALPAPLGPAIVDPLEEPENIREGGGGGGGGDYYAMIKDLLLRTGIQAHNNGNVRFVSIDTHPYGKLQAVGELDSGQQAAICLAQKHASLSKTEVELSIQEAQKLVPEPDVLFFLAQSFTSEAQTAIDEKKWPGKNLRRAVIDPDIFMSDLKGAKKNSDSPFWLVGQPDIKLQQNSEGKFVVEILGFDYFDPTSGECLTGGTSKIAVWSLDIDYDGRTMYPSQIFFPQTDDWAKLAKNLKAVIDSVLIRAYEGSVSLPFEPGKYSRAAVKVVDSRGVESMCTIPLDKTKVA